jgi:hypothetical protein
MTTMTAATVMTLSVRLMCADPPRRPHARSPVAHLHLLPPLRLHRRSVAPVS